MIKNSNNFIIIAVGALYISIIFSLSTITTIETTYANHTKYHLNNSLVDVTISSDDDIPDALLEDIKRNIVFKAEQKKASENNNNSQLQTKPIEDTPKAKIILTGQNYIEKDNSNFDDIIGQVKNIGNGTAESIKTIFTFYDSNGNMVGTDFTYIDIDKLNPGQKAPFSETIDKREIQNGHNMKYHYHGLIQMEQKNILKTLKLLKDPQQKIPIIENTKQANNENENFPFFTTDGKDIGKPGDDEDEEDDNDEDEDEDSDDKDNN